jgi:hypothetical protein
MSGSLPDTDKQTDRQTAYKRLLVCCCMIIKPVLAVNNLCCGGIICHIAPKKLPCNFNPKWEFDSL